MAMEGGRMDHVASGPHVNHRRWESGQIGGGVAGFFLGVLVFWVALFPTTLAVGESSYRGVVVMIEMRVVVGYLLMGDHRSNSRATFLPMRPTTT